MFNFLRKYYLKIMNHCFAKRLKYLVRYEEEKRILEGFREPTTDVERSFYQHKCQMMAEMDWKIECLFNIYSIIMFFPTILYLYICSFFCKTQKNGARIVITMPLSKELVPQELRRTCDEIVVLDRGKGRLDFKDLQFLFKIVRMYPFSPFFCYKCAYYISVYSYGIYRFQPKIILTHSEDSSASSVLTMYCEQQGIQHCNIQHGEKSFRIKYAFSRFSKFYVWDMHYVRLFNELRTGTKREDFIVYSFIIPQAPILIEKHGCTYYLQCQTEDELLIIKKCLDQLKTTYKVRPHPAHIRNSIFKVFDAACIEDPRSVSVWESIASSQMVMSINSTVLFQAYLMNVQVVLDDVSNPEYSLELRKRKYIMFEKPHFLLSELCL